MKLLLFLLLTCPVFIFAQNKPDTVSKGSDKDGNKEKVEEVPVFLVVEEMPEYPGGEEAMLKFINRNLKYPRIALEGDVQGTVYISFDITEKGDIINIKVVRGKGSGLDEEAVRVVKMMPRWKPGKQNGKAVRVQFTLPVHFTLE